MASFMRERKALKSAMESVMREDTRCGEPRSCRTRRGTRPTGIERRSARPLAPPRTTGGDDLPRGGDLDDLLAALRLPLGALRRIPDILAEEVDELQNPRLLLGVDLVRGVGRLVIVAVRAVEEEQDRHALPREVVVIGAEVEALVRPDVVNRVHAELGMVGGHAVERRAEVRVLLADDDDRVVPRLRVA